MSLIFSMAMSPSTADLRPPLLPVSENDHGAWVITVSNILLILSLLGTVVTLISRIRVIRALGWSDIVLAIGCLLFIPQTACINIASSNGIGRRGEALAAASYEKYSKGLYSSQLLSVVVLGCSKAAVVLLVLSLKPFERITLACKISLGTICAWVVAALFALGLQCDRPDPWELSSGRCVDQYTLYVILAVTHMLLDLAVTSLPVILLWQIQMLRERRYHISALFGMRLFVVVLTIPAIRSLSPYFHASPRDRPWHALMPAIWLQLIQSASILCTCVPTLKRVLADLQTGMMGGAVSDFFEMSVSGARSNPDGSGSKPDSAASASAPRTRSRSAGVWSGFHRSHSVVERVESQERLRDDVIVQSLEYEVRYGARGSSTSHDVDYDEH